MDSSTSRLTLNNTKETKNSTQNFNFDNYREEIKRNIVKLNAHIMPDKFRELFPGEPLPDKASAGGVRKAHKNESLSLETEARGSLDLSSMNSPLDKMDVEPTNFDMQRAHTSSTRTSTREPATKPEFTAPVAQMMPPKRVRMTQHTTPSSPPFKIRRPSHDDVDFTGINASPSAGSDEDSLGPDINPFFRRNNSYNASQPSNSIMESPVAEKPTNIKTNLPLSTRTNSASVLAPTDPNVSRKKASNFLGSTQREDGKLAQIAASQSTSDNAFAPPEWYLNKSRAQIERKFKAFPKSRKRNVEAFLSSLKEAISNSDVDKIREKIQQARFTPDIKEDELFITKMLNREHGLPTVFLSDDKFPWDVRADAKELYRKWAFKDFDTDLLRGIDMKSKQHSRNADRLDKTFNGRRPAKFHGVGHLVNGQWWPTQLCTVRDGAHGAAQGGISGKTGEGAYSVVISGGSRYDDEDRGEEIFYCGTDGEDGKATSNTQHLALSQLYQTPVRVLRSAGLHKSNPYRPLCGIRYDGLYIVEDYEIVDQDKQIHRFHLKRLPGQDPIRYEGVEARPTKIEVENYKKIRNMIKGLE